MKESWYIAATSNELDDELLACTIFGEQIVLYRDEAGLAHALLDHCSHRGARLSDGKRQGGCVACPFHGWEYNGEGACTYIPANGRESPIPSGARVRSYPVREVSGYVWVYLGKAAQVPELKLPPELTDPAWQAVPFQAHWQAHITRVVESILDVAHLPFVHPNTTGEVDPRVDGPEFTVSDDEICVIAKPFHPLLRTPLNEQDHNGASTITLTFPNQMILRTDMSAENTMATYLTFTPTGNEEDGDSETIIFGLSLRNFLQDVEMIDDIHYEHNVTVLEEDRSVVEGLRPKRVPLNLRAEQHVRADAQQVRFRLMLKKCLMSKHNDDHGGEMR